MKTILLLASCVVILNISISSAQSGALDFSFSDDGRLITSFQKSVYAYHAASAAAGNGKTVVIGFDYGDFTPGNSCYLARFNGDGSLDKTFGENGKIITLKNEQFLPHAVAVQANGKIVAVGENTSNNQIELVRFNNDGKLDNTFSQVGKVITELGSKSRANSVAVQTDGKILITGYFYNGTDIDFLLMRCNSDGTLDNSFNGTGIIKRFGSFFDAGYAVAVLPNGKIVVAGRINNNGNYDFITARYTSIGKLDKTFDGDGVVITDIEGNFDQANSIAVQADGKIVVAGYSYLAGDFVVSLARYNTDGSLDGTFSANGKHTESLGETYGAESMVIDTTGKIIVGAHSNSFGAVLRFNINGSLDPTFNGDGKVYTSLELLSEDFRGFNFPVSVTLQGGKIALAGSYYNTSATDFAVFRYNFKGNIDKTFSSDGIATAEFKTENLLSSARSVAIQSDKKIVVAGSPGLSRYKPNGTLDAAFNLNGEGTVNISKYVDPYGIAIQTDGKIVVAGRSDDSTKNFTVARLNSNGTIDNTFGTKGKVVTDFGNSEDFISNGNCIALQTDGKIVVVGYTFNPTTLNYDVALARYNTNGTLDKTFDVDGKVTTDVMGTNDYGQAIAIQADGRIVVAGYSKNTHDYDFAVLRYSSNGKLDNSFSGDGKATFGISYKNNDYGKAVKIQSDGKIVVGGYAYNGTINEFAVARFNTDGSPDNGFSSDGKTTIRIENSSNNYCTSVAIQLDGKIVLGGYYNSSNGGLNNFALVRYHANGDIDNGFGNSGKKVMDYGFTEDYAYASALQPDGQLVVAGSSNGNFAVARFLTAAPAAISPMQPLIVDYSKIPDRSGLLQQNTPNPFNHTTTINYNLPQTYSSAKIVVTDKSGKTLKQINLAAKGNGSLNINASTLASGTYQYSLYVDGKLIDTRQMVLIR